MNNPLDESSCLETSSEEIEHEIPYTTDEILEQYHLIPELLHIAAESGDDSICKAIIEYGSGINKKDENGQTPLFRAVKSNNLKICRMLLDAKAKVNTTDTLGITPFQYSIKLKHRDISELLLSAGADPNFSTLQPPLHDCIMDSDVESCQFLIDHGANVNQINDKFGQTALHVCINISNEDIAKKITKILIDAGANVNKKNKHEVTLLALAAHHNNEPVCRVLLENLAEVNARDYSGSTPLHLLMNNPIVNISLLHLLLDAGADINAQNNIGMTPLAIACMFSNVDCIKTLLDFGANINCPTNWNAPIMCSLRKPEKYEFLMSYGPILLKEMLVDENDSEGIVMIREEIRRRNEGILKLLLLEREYDRESPFYKENLPLDMMKIILHFSGVLNFKNEGERSLKKIKVEKNVLWEDDSM